MRRAISHGRPRPLVVNDELGMARVWCEEKFDA